MNPFTVILGVLLFAFVTAVLVLWGMRKSYFQRETLTKMLFSKSSERVMQYLKTHDTISESEIRKLVDGIKASEFHSRQKATIHADRIFTSRLIEIMQSENLIEPLKHGKSIYRKKGGK